MKKSNKLTYSIIAALLFSGPILHQLDLIPDNMAIKINEDCMDLSESVSDKPVSVSDCSLRAQALSFLWPTHIVIDLTMEFPEPLEGIPYPTGFVEFQVKNGLKNVEKWYDPNGQLEREAPYENDKIHGVIKGYYGNGQLEIETPYENGKKHGVEKEYRDNGQLSRETPYENWEKHGVEKVYDENGQLKEEVVYENGVNK